MCINKVKILPDYSGHNPVILTYERKARIYRWRLNETLLQKELIMESYKKTLKGFLEIKHNKGTDIRTVRDFSKVFMRGQFIQGTSKLKRQRVDAKDFNEDKNERGGIKEVCKKGKKSHSK